MHITKYEHACLILNNGESRLIIDPGTFTNLPDDLTNICCIIITEEHMDHYNLQNIQAILIQSPDSKIISTQSVASLLKDTGLNCDSVVGEVQIEAESFTLKLKEVDHAEIYKTSPCKVLTVQVDDFLYYPSDSFIPTEATVQVLALPTSGPWHKISESVTLANHISSKYVLATHNGLYNDIGNNVTNNFTANNIADKNKEYVFLAAGESRQF